MGACRMEACILMSAGGLLAKVVAGAAVGRAWKLQCNDYTASPLLAASAVSRCSAACARMARRNAHGRVVLVEHAAWRRTARVRT
jgi:hypothetical protein